MAEVWTIKRCLDWTRDYLKDNGEDRARLLAEWMLSSVTGLTRTGLYMEYNRPLSREELDLMHGYVVRRRKGEPIQYILGETQFRTINVACEPGVLIPRPETEMLVEEVLAYLDAEVIPHETLRRRIELPWNAEVEAARNAERERLANGVREADGTSGVSDPEGYAEGASVGMDANAAEEDMAAPSDSAYDGEADALATAGDAPAPDPRIARVLEIGCGTGCISLSLAAERAGRVHCIATDIEPRAVALSQRNRDALGIGPELVEFREGDLVSPIAPEEEGFDVLVSNPPYIPEAVMGRLPAEVSQYEPHLALASGSDGLDMFRRILGVSSRMLRPGGLLACELYEGSLDAAASLCLAVGLTDVCIVNDLAGRPRIIRARRA